MTFINERNIASYSKKMNFKCQILLKSSKKKPTKNPKQNKEKQVWEKEKGNLLMGKEKKPKNKPTNFQTRVE